MSRRNQSAICCCRRQENRQHALLSGVNQALAKLASAQPNNGSLQTIIARHRFKLLFTLFRNQKIGEFDKDDCCIQGDSEQRNNSQLWHKAKWDSSWVNFYAISIALLILVQYINDAAESIIVGELCQPFQQRLAVICELGANFRTMLKK